MNSQTGDKKMGSKSEYLRKVREDVMAVASELQDCQDMPELLHFDRLCELMQAMETACDNLNEAINIAACEEKN
jgi:hypothetical protein